MDKSEIKSLLLTDPASETEITFNGWDFGGQNIYRPTHQLFFTSPAIYLVVWNPRRGPDVCKVDEWIKMVKHRAYDERRPDERPRVLVVATHGGPKERLDHPEPGDCDNCWRPTMISDGWDDWGLFNGPGACIACGYIRTREDTISDALAFRLSDPKL